MATNLRAQQPTLEDQPVISQVNFEASQDVEVRNGDLDEKFAFGRGWRSYGIVTALSVIALLPAIEGTIVSTALPTIVADLKGEGQYVWVVNSYFLTR